MPAAASCGEGDVGAWWVECLRFPLFYLLTPANNIYPFPLAITVLQNDAIKGFDLQMD